jgi:ABC-type Fe3+ transport system permease subunit
VTIYSTSRFFDIVSYTCLPNFGCCIDLSSCIDVLGSKKSQQQRIDTIHGQKTESKTAEDKVTSPVTRSSIWILLLSIAMILSAIGDTGFAFSTAYGSDTVEREVWIWDIFYNSCGLCLAAALIGYKSFFSFNRIDTLQH